MNDNEIFDTYNELGSPDAFEAFEAANVDVDDIQLCLGSDVVDEYLDWIYENVK